MLPPPVPPTLHGGQRSSTASCPSSTSKFKLSLRLRGGSFLSYPTRTSLPLQASPSTTDGAPWKTWNAKVQLNEAGLGSPGHRLLNGHRTQVAATSKAGLKRLSSSFCVALPDPFLTCLWPRNAARPGSVISPGEEPAPSQRWHWYPPAQASRPTCDPKTVREQVKSLLLSHDCFLTCGSTHYLPEVTPARKTYLVRLFCHGNQQGPRRNMPFFSHDHTRTELSVTSNAWENQGTHPW